MERGREADFAGFLRVYLKACVKVMIPVVDKAYHTPLRVAFEARLAFALCLPPIGAVSNQISSQYHMRDLGIVSHWRFAWGCENWLWIVELLPRD